jgi:hypothetical protein
MGECTRSLESRAKDGDLRGMRSLVSDLDRLWERLREEMTGTLAALSPGEDGVATQATN